MANILIDVGHPAHVHLFRGAARRWEAAGHTVLFAALDREIILYLLARYDLPHAVTYRRGRGKLALLLELFVRTWTTYRLARRFRPDLFIGIGSPMAGLPARLMGKPYIALTDTEGAGEQHLLFRPFASVIATPDAFYKSLGAKQVRYPGYHELAYLHPDEFTPDPAVLQPLGLTSDDTFFIVRFVTWGATHDIGERGFALAEKRAMLRELSRHGRVLLSSEGGIDPEFAPLVTPFPPEAIHHLLAFATLYVGEGATMATEAAVLGTPAVYVNTLRAGTTAELEEKYHLLYWCRDGQQAMQHTRELLAMPGLEQVAAQRRARLLAEKINPTPWLADLGERLLQDPSYRPDTP